MKIEEALAGVRSPGIEASPFIYFAASAVLARCEAFLTNDHDLRRVTEVRVLVLDDLEFPSANG